MGSPLSPIIADIVMQETTLNTLKLDLIFYIRYVNDIALAAPIDKIDNILSMFNDYTTDDNDTTD